MLIVVHIAIIALAVLVHYEFLKNISAIIPKMKVNHRLRILIGVFGALIAHSIEIFLFALAYYFAPVLPNWGELQGNFTGTLADCIYFSYTTFTTLGLGDIQPRGTIRQLVGMESLTGLLLITWTASFLYYEMQRYWGKS